MGFFLGVLLGVVIGAVVIYLAMARQVSAQEAALRNLRGKLTQAEADHDRRIKVATERLQQDYAARITAAQDLQQKLTATEAERDRLQQDYSTHLQAAQTDAEQQVRQKLAQAEADYNRRLQAEIERLRQDYEDRLAAAQSGPPLIPTSPQVSAPTELITLPHPNPTNEPRTSTASAQVPLPTEPFISSGSEAAVSPDVLTPSGSGSVNPPSVSYGEASLAATSSRLSPLTDVNILTKRSYAPDPKVRCQVAKALAATLPNTRTTEHGRWMPLLKRLVLDNDPAVRRQAVSALSKVKASRSLPLLRRALRDTNPAVVAAAHQAMSRFKGYASPQPSSRKLRLPKNR